MRIGNYDLSKHRTKRVFLPRGDGPAVQVILTALPVGEADRAERLFRPPSAPEVFETDAAGRVKFIQGTDPPKAMVKRDLLDQNYLRESENVARRQSIYVIRRGLRDDPDVHFDADTSPGAPSGERANDSAAWATYLDAVYAELGEAHFTDPEIHELMRQTYALGLPSPDAVKAARDSFLSQAGGSVPGESQLIEPLGTKGT